jgi:hypothetical protein
MIKPIKYKPKPKKCKNCGKEFMPYTTTSMVCSASCALEYNSEKQVKKRVKELKKGLLTHSDYTQVLQKLINQIVRNIDTNFPCISSGRTTGQMHGGHLFPTSSYPEIRFNLFNIWKQSAADNTYKSGNINDYRNGLIDLYGGFSSNYIFNLPEQYKVLKLSSYELQDKITVAKQIIKEQKEGLHIAVSNQDRITIRSILNKRLDIYK